MRIRFVITAVLLAGFSVGKADAEWKPDSGSWQATATANIIESFGEHTFDQLIWSDESSLWVLRPDLGLRQDIVAATVCKVVNRSGRPADEAVEITFYDTAAFRDGKLKDHGVAVCKG